jgi:hypothetical protein
VWLLVFSKLLSLTSISGFWGAQQARKGKKRKGKERKEIYPKIRHI